MCTRYPAAVVFHPLLADRGLLKRSNVVSAKVGCRHRVGFVTGGQPNFVKQEPFNGTRRRVPCCFFLNPDNIGWSSTDNTVRKSALQLSDGILQKLDNSPRSRACWP